MRFPTVNFVIHFLQMFDCLSSYIPNFPRSSSYFQKQFNDFLGVLKFKAIQFKAGKETYIFYNKD